VLTWTPPPAPAAPGETTPTPTPTPTTPPGAGAGPPSGAVTPPVTSALVPAIAGESLSPRTFAAAPSGSSVLAAKRRYGTKVSYTLNSAASVRFTVVRSRRGRKTTLRGSFTLAGNSGANSFRFTGRLAGHKLKPGSYRLVATPSAAGKPGRAASAAFQIIR
jgi:hypothetical protein